MHRHPLNLQVTIFALLCLFFTGITSGQADDTSLGHYHTEYSTVITFDDLQENESISDQYLEAGVVFDQFRVMTDGRYIPLTGTVFRGISVDDDMWALMPNIRGGRLALVATFVEPVTRVCFLTYDPNPFEIVFTAFSGGNEVGRLSYQPTTFESLVELQFDGEFDSLEIYKQRGATYINDFEFLPSPTDKGQCKKDGWMSFGIFRNQGDCVSFVATQGKNVPAGK